MEHKTWTQIKFIMEPINIQQESRIKFRDESFYGTVEKELGAGTYGEVYEYVKPDTAQKYAVKVFISEEDPVATLFGIEDDTPHEVSADALREIAILSKISHPNIIKLIDIIDYNAADPRSPIKMVLELASYSLDDYITKPAYANLKFSTATMKSYIYQLCRGLNYLHANNIWHRDIKPANILIFHDVERIVFADFGVSRFGTIISNNYSGMGTLFWRAPELLLGSTHYGPEVDVFALGITFADMIIKEYMLKSGAAYQTTEDAEMGVLLEEALVLGSMTEKQWPGISGYKNYNTEFATAADRFRHNKIFELMENDPIGMSVIWLIRDMTKPNPSNRIPIKNYKFYNERDMQFAGAIRRVEANFPFPAIPDYKCGANLQKGILDENVAGEFTETDNVLNISPESIITTTGTSILTRDYSYFFDWMSIEATKYRYRPETIFYTRLLFDLFVSEHNKLMIAYSDEDTGKLSLEYWKLNLFPFNVDTLYTIGSACYLIATELFEITPQSIGDLVNRAANTFTEEELIRAQLTVLKVIKFNLIFPTAAEFLYYYTEDLSEQPRQMAMNLALAYNLIGEATINSKNIAQAAAFVVSRCSNEMSKCLSHISIANGLNGSNGFMENIVSNLKNSKRRNPNGYDKEKYAKIEIILSNWNLCQTRPVNLINTKNRNTDRNTNSNRNNNNSTRKGEYGNMAVAQPINHVRLVQLLYNANLNITQVKNIKSDKNNEIPYTREDILDLLAIILLNQAAFFSNNTLPRDSVERTEFSRYFQLKMSDNGSYRHFNRIPKYITFKFGSLESKTINVNIILEHVSSNIVNIFDRFIVAVLNNPHSTSMLQGYLSQ